MKNSLQALGLLSENTLNRYAANHPSYIHHATFLAATESLSAFLNQDHKQFIPGGSTQPNTSTDSSKNVQAGSDAVKKFQAISAPSEAEIDELADAFLAHPSAAVSTLLNAARSEAGWNPLSGDTKESAEGFSRYTEILASIKLFEIVDTQTKTLHYESKDYSSLIKKASSALKSIFDGELDKIQDSLTDLAIACTSQSNTENTATVFSQGEVTTESAGKDVFYSIAYSWMKMVYSVNSGKSAPADVFQQETQTMGAKFKFTTVTFTRTVARQLANLQLGVSTLEQFIADTTTPKAPAATRSCLRNKKAEEKALA